MGFTLDGIRIGADTHHIDQIESVNVDPLINQMIAQGSSRIDPSFAANIDQAPNVNFTSSAIKKILSAFGLSGLLCDAAADPPPVLPAVLGFRQYAQGGTYGAATSTEMTINLALAYLMSIEASLSGNAVASCAIAPVTDGTNAPILIAKNQTLTFAPQAEDYYTIGKVFVNGAELAAGVQRIRFNVGPNIRRERQAGSVYPHLVSIRGRQPTIEIDVLDLDVLDDGAGALSLVGTPIFGLTRVYFQKIVKGGTLAAADSAVHIGLEIPDGMIVARPIAGQKQGDAGYSIQITPTQDFHDATPDDVVVLGIGEKMDLGAW